MSQIKFSFIPIGSKKRLWVTFCETVGYYPLLIQENNTESVLKRNREYSFFSPIFLTDVPPLSEEEKEHLYALMQKVDEIFKKSELRYWAGGGTPP